MENIFITGTANANSEGITLILNKPAPLTGTLKSKTWWVSWDKIGESLFKDCYCADERQNNPSTGK